MQLSIRVQGTLVRNGLQNLDAEIPKVSRLVIYRSSQRIVQRVKRPGARPNHPINWVSARQRKGFFASEGFGGGVPTRRSNRYINSWKIVSKDDIGYTVINDSPGAKFVGGDAYGQSQSPIHAGRWPLFRDEFEAEVNNLAPEIAKEILMVSRRNGLTQ